MQEEPTIYVGDDESSLRQAMDFLFNSIGMKVQAFESAAEFLENYVSGQPGCLLLDVRMPMMNGLELQKVMREREIELPIIMISGHGDIQLAVEAMKMGAIDFIEKPFRDQTLIDVVQKAIEIDRQKRQANQNTFVIKARYGELSEREKEVLLGIVAGKANKCIAQKMNLSQKTIEFHRSHVMKKMHAESLAELVKMIGSIQKEAIPR
jgi:two-component system, LuxR family, response regulator FixJ